MSWFQVVATVVSVIAGVFLVSLLTWNLIKFNDLTLAFSEAADQIKWLLTAQWRKERQAKRRKEMLSNLSDEDVQIVVSSRDDLQRVVPVESAAEAGALIGREFAEGITNAMATFAGFLSGFAGATSVQPPESLQLDAEIKLSEEVGEHEHDDDEYHFEECRRCRWLAEEEPTSRGKTAQDFKVEHDLRRQNIEIVGSDTCVCHPGTVLHVRSCPLYGQAKV